MSTPAKYAALCALVALALTCNRQGSDKAGDGKGEETKGRPDAAGINPPGWYLAGAKLKNRIRFNGDQQNQQDDVGLKYQSCTFAFFAASSGYFFLNSVI